MGTPGQSYFLKQKQKQKKELLDFLNVASLDMIFLKDEFLKKKISLRIFLFDDKWQMSLSCILKRCYFRIKANKGSS